METSWTCRDHTIALTDDRQFIVSGPLFDEDAREHSRTFDSYRSATQAIIDRADAAAKQQRATARISLAALDAAGNPITIRGIHARLGTALGIPDNSIEYLRDESAYPDVAWLRALLVERAGCANRIAEINRATFRYAIKRLRSYRLKGDDYAPAVEALEQEHAAKLAAAIEAAPKPEAAE